MVQIKHRIENKICVVTIEGNMALKEASIVQEYITPFLEDESILTLIVNFDQVGLLDSTGIGVLFFAHKTLDQRKAKLILCHLNEKSLVIFKMTRLNQILNIFNTEEEALAALR